MKIFRVSLVIAIMSISLSSCLKQSFDNPPDLTSYDPNLPVNLKIRDLVSPYWGTSGGFRVLGDSTIYGVVVADDRSGNFYKQIIIQDSTGGISIGINNSYLYNDYPIGRKVYVKLKGLTIMAYKGTPEIIYSVSANGATTTDIPSTSEDSFVVGASFPNTITPIELRLSAPLISAPFQYLNMLVKLDDMQFDSTVVGLPYALPSNVAISTSRAIDGCIGGTPNGTLVLYNSGYADFYNAKIPSGYGSITGIWTLYSGTNQFQIRDTTDVQFTQPRCH